MKILVVDDDRVLADLITFTLRREGFQVIQAHDGETALQRWTDDQPDLLVLDVNLPLLDGFSVCRRIRERATTPIVLLTVWDEDDDVVHGLGLGADDYLTKPFSPRRLVAHVQAVLRRTNLEISPAHHQIGDLRFDPGRREVRLGQNRLINLTPLESRLLNYLMLNAGHVLATESIITHIWGTDEGDRDALRQLVRRLRSKIETDSAQPTYIETIPSLGYGFINPTD
jgi:DNA-binding response OmpR family regulator